MMTAARLGSPRNYIKQTEGRSSKAKQQLWAFFEELAAGFHQAEHDDYKIHKTVDFTCIDRLYIDDRYIEPIDVDRRMLMSDRYTRELMRGSLDLIVLSVLSDEPKYGYLIQQRVREVSGGRVDLQAGTLYPLLHRLEADKLVRCRWESTTGRKRKWYELTATGHRRLKQQAEQWHVYAQCIGQLLSSLAGPQPRTA